MDELNWSPNPCHCDISFPNFGSSSFGSLIRIRDAESSVELWKLWMSHCTKNEVFHE